MRNRTYTTFRMSGLTSMALVLLVALAASMTSEASSTMNAIAGESTSVLDATALTVLIASVINAVVPAKYQSFVGPVVRILSLAFWSGKNADLKKD